MNDRSIRIAGSGSPLRRRTDEDAVPKSLHADPVPSPDQMSIVGWAAGSMNAASGICRHSAEARDRAGDLLEVIEQAAVEQLGTGEVDRQRDGRRGWPRSTGPWPDGGRTG